MPSVAAHMVVAKLISDKLNIEDPDFIKGNLLPDILDKELSHHKKQGKYYLIPDIQFFKEKRQHYTYRTTAWTMGKTLKYDTYSL